MDLINQAFQVSQHSARADENVHVLFNIENVTDNLIDDIGVKFYISRNSWISTGDHVEFVSYWRLKPSSHL